MKNYFKRTFADQSNIEYWYNIYDRQDFSGDSYRQRMGMALSWLESMNLSENSTILDAGCGPGRFAHEAARSEYKVFGMDSSLEMLEKASTINDRQVGRNLAFLQGDVEALPLRDSSFDMIICLGVVAYLRSEHILLHELARVLRPGGMLAISIVNKARLAHRLDLPILFLTIFDRVRKVTALSRKKSAEIDHIPHLTTYFIPQFQKSLELAGFTVLEYRTTPWNLVTFFGREIIPHRLAKKVTLFFERFKNLPMVGSFGGMCIFKAEKNLVSTAEKSVGERSWVRAVNDQG